MSVPGRLRDKAAFLVALVIVMTLYVLAREPGLSPGERSSLAAKFNLQQTVLTQPPGPELKTVRDVHPSLKRIAAWISATGASVALADVDADGLPNDICRTEPRTDQLIVQPAPGTGERYASFVLVPNPLPYDARTMAPTGCLAGDLNEDGRMDLLAYYWGRTPVAFLRTSGEPGQVSALSAGDFQPVEIMPEVERWNTNSGVLADLDGDGHLDLMVGNFYQDGARLLDSQAQGTEFLHGANGRAENGGAKHLLLWEAGSHAPASVRYREAKNVFSDAVNRGWLLAIGTADLDGDQLPEIYFAHDYGKDTLLHNRSTPGKPRFEELVGRREFTTPTSLVLGEDSFKGMGVDFTDVNRDGVPDIFVSNITQEYGFQESHFLWMSTGQNDLMQQGVAPYVTAAERLGLSRTEWGWDARIVDLNNDTLFEAMQATGFFRGTISRWPELQSLGTANDELVTYPSNWPSFAPGADVAGHTRLAFLTQQSPDGRFFGIGPDVGFTDPMVSRGIAIADVDGDGLQDFAVAAQWQDSIFVRNNGPSAGAFLGLHLLLPIEPGSATRVRASHPGPDLFGRPAIGAQVRVKLEDGRLFVGQSDGGSGHSGKRSPDVFLGLGNVPASEVLAVDVQWRDPSGRVRKETLSLTPGWHTVVLGWSNAAAGSTE